MDKKLSSVNVSSSGNLVSVIMGRDKKILSIELDDSLLDKSQKELLEEFIISTVNEANEKVDNISNIDIVEENDVEVNRENMPHNDFFDVGKINKIANDLSKLTSVGKDENGKPVLNIPLDSINPAMIKNMFDMMKDNKDKE